MKKSLRAAAVAAAAVLALSSCANPLFSTLNLLRMKLLDGGPGSLDTSFDPGTGVQFMMPGDAVQVIRVQSDGKYLIGGAFIGYDGTPLANIARILPSGAHDTSFTAGPEARVTGITVVADGKVLVGGAFSGAPPHLRRYSATGAIDPLFIPTVNGAVRQMTVQADGRILISGDFSTINGLPHVSIGRLLANANLDDSFSCDLNASLGVPWVAWFERLANGQVLAAGRFNRYLGLPCKPCIVRLDSNGDLDETFNSLGTGMAYSAMDPEIYAAALQPDGKILLGGMFDEYNGDPVPFLVRLNSDGSLDSSFNSGGLGPNNPVWAIALQADGRILIGGQFVKYNGINAEGLARVNPDGSLDESFDTSHGVGAVPGSSKVCAISVLPDGRIMIVGDFSEYSDTPRMGIARIWD